MAHKTNNRKWMQIAHSIYSVPKADSEEKKVEHLSSKRLRRNPNEIASQTIKLANKTTQSATKPDKSMKGSAFQAEETEEIKPTISTKHLVTSRAIGSKTIGRTSVYSHSSKAAQPVVADREKIRRGLLSPSRVDKSKQVREPVEQKRKPREYGHPAVRVDRLAIPSENPAPTPQGTAKRTPFDIAQDSNEIKTHSKAVRNAGLVYKHGPDKLPPTVSSCVTRNQQANNDTLLHTTFVLQQLETEITEAIRQALLNSELRSNCAHMILRNEKQQRQPRIFSSPTHPRSRSGGKEVSNYPKNVTSQNDNQLESKIPPPEEDSDRQPKISSLPQMHQHNVSEKDQQHSSVQEHQNSNQDPEDLPFAQLAQSGHLLSQHESHSSHFGVADTKMMIHLNEVDSVMPSTWSSFTTARRRDSVQPNIHYNNKKMKSLLAELLDLLTFQDSPSQDGIRASPPDHGVFDNKHHKILRLHPTLYLCLRHDLTLLLEIVTRVGWEADEVQRTLLPISRTFRAAEKVLNLRCGALTLKQGRRLFNEWRLAIGK